MPSTPFLVMLFYQTLFGASETTLSLNLLTARFRTAAFFLLPHNHFSAYSYENNILAHLLNAARSCVTKLCKQAMPSHAPSPI